MTIDVGEKTTVEGALINSGTGELSLSTNELEVSDLGDSEVYSNRGGSVGIGSGGLASLGVDITESERTGITRGTIGEGTIEVRSLTPEQTQELLNEINRDVDAFRETLNEREFGVNGELDVEGLRALGEVFEKLEATRRTIEERKARVQEGGEEDSTIAALEEQFVLESSHAFEGLNVALFAAGARERAIADCQASGGADCEARGQEAFDESVKISQDAQIGTGIFIAENIPFLGGIIGGAECVNSPSAGSCGGAVAGTFGVIGNALRNIFRAGDAIGTAARGADDAVDVFEPGANITPNSTLDNFANIGRNGTFVTEVESIERITGRIPDGATEIRITRQQADLLEADLGLNPGSLEKSNTLSIVDDIQGRCPRCPISGNDQFEGAGRGLPGGGSELVIDSIPSTGGDGIRQITVIVE